MSFAFGFGGDDIENESENEELSQQVESITINDTPLIPPKKHTLQELLSFLPSQVVYSLLSVAPQQGSDALGKSEIIIPRRSVFDIRTQLMAEANPEENENDNLLAGLENGDLTSGIYEGGFKTWECSLDLASLVAELDIRDGLHIVEMGAGSAVPSLVALQIALRRSECPRLSFTLCDYNEDVLRLTTAPNVFLAAETSRHDDTNSHTQDDLDIDDIDEDTIKSSIDYLEARGVSFNFVSGAWGEDFLPLVQSVIPDSTRPCTTLVLASETIYSPKSTTTFAHTLIKLLRRDVSNTRAWVAAKKVYFGVGGGIDDFVSQIEMLGGFVKTLLDVKGAGVGRVVLEITINS